MYPEIVRISVSHLPYMAVVKFVRFFGLNLGEYVVLRWSLVIMSKCTKPLIKLHAKIFIHIWPS